MAYKIDGKDIPQPQIKPGNKLFGRHQVKRAFRNANVDMVQKVIANQKKTVFTYELLTDEEVRVLEDIIGAKHDRGIDEFDITFYRPGFGWITERMYCGAELEFTVEAVQGGKPVAWSTEISFIQLKGKIKI